MSTKRAVFCSFSPPLVELLNAFEGESEGESESVKVRVW